MIPARRRLLALLADGACIRARSWRALGISRTAVWKDVAELRERGIAIESHDRQRLPARAARRTAGCGAMRAAARRTARRFPKGARSCSRSIPPTNTCMRSRRPARPAASRVRRAATRGPRPSRPLVARAVRVRADLLDRLDVRRPALGPRRIEPRHGRAGRAGAAPPRRRVVRLKWPNDLVVGPAKLGGLLIQLRSGRAGLLTSWSGSASISTCRRPRAQPSRHRARFRQATSANRRGRAARPERAGRDRRRVDAREVWSDSRATATRRSRAMAGTRRAARPAGADPAGRPRRRRHARGTDASGALLHRARRAHRAVLLRGGEPPRRAPGSAA